MKRAFTLIELLVVIAIIAILAAILFPVFAQAKTAAKKTVWLSNFKQNNLAMPMYGTDNDDISPPADSTGKIPGYRYCFGCGRPDYTWVELVQPYVKNWQIIRCPVDSNNNDATISHDPLTDAVLKPSDPNYYYAWAERSNIGMNHVFISPWYAKADGSEAGSRPVSTGQVQQPAATIATIDTIWDRNTGSGAPVGGGNWLAEAPCELDSNGNHLVPVTPFSEWVNYGGWVPNPTGKAPYNWLEFGGAYPFFGKRFMIGFYDGHVKSMSLGDITAGCDVKPAQAGAAYDGDKYLWDNR